MHKTSAFSHLSYRLFISLIIQLGARLLPNTGFTLRRFGVFTGDAILAGVLAVIVYLCVCHMPVLYQNG